MAIVLCDGSAASLKAVDVALVPQLVLRQHKDEQLILLHGWNDVNLNPPAGAPPTPQSLQLQSASLHTMVASTMDQIDKNKHAKDTLNYKLEILRLSQVIAPQPTASGVASPYSSSPVPRAPTPMASPKAPQAAAKVSQAAQQPPTPAEPADDVPPPASQASVVAAHVGSYVANRALHHNARQIILGIGNESNGKTHHVGSVAKRLYSMAVDAPGKEDDGSCGSHALIPWTLWFVKPTGSVVRPNQSVKFLVLLDAHAEPHVAMSPLHFTLSELALAGRNDRVTALVIANNSTPRALSLSKEDRIHVAEQQFSKTVRDLLIAAGQSAEGDGEGVVPSTADDPSAAQNQQAVTPLVATVVIDGTAANPQPHIDDVPQQLLKAIGKFKCDFLVTPQKSSHTLSEATFLLLLGLLRPHVILPPDTAV